VKVGEGTSEVITSVAALPKEQYSVHAIILDNNSGNIKPFTDADFGVCGGLEKLDWIALNKLDITPAAFDTLCTCPNLTKITIQYNRMGDELWTHLAGAKKLITLFQNYDGLPVRGIGLSKLSNETLTQLNLAHTALSDEALPELAALTRLGQLYLEDTKVTDAGIKALVTLKKLTRMQLHNTEVTASGLAALKSLPIAKLGYGSNLASTVSQAKEVAALFPKLDELLLPRECNPTAEDWSTLAKAWPKLRRVTVSSHILDDASCAGLLPLTTLEELDLNYCPVTDTGVASLAALKKLFWLSIPNAKINDAALDTLAKIKPLKTLKLPKPGNGLTADGIAKFKKQRPDIQVN
jgi:Leucine-rich repeat (LRR) protein